MTIPEMAGTGISLGAVLMLRVNMIAVWIVGLIVLIILGYKRNELKQQVLALLFMLFCALLTITPFIIWLYMNGAAKEFIHDYIVFNYMYVDDAELSTFKKIMDILSSLLFFLNNPVVILAFVAGITSHGKNRGVALTSVAYLIVTLLTMSISGNRFPHYGMILAPPICATIAIALYQIMSPSDYKLYSEAALSYIAIVAVIVSFVIPNWISLTQAALSQYSDKPIRYTIDGDAGEAIALVTRHTKPDDKITVYGNRDVVYLASSRMSVSKYSYQSPIAQKDPRIESEYFADLDNQPPAAVVIADNAENIERMMEFLKVNEYEQVGKTTKGWTIWIPSDSK